MIANLSLQGAKNPVRKCMFSPDTEHTPEICSRPFFTTAPYSSRKHWSVSGRVITRDRASFLRVNEPRNGVPSAPTLNVHHMKIQSSRFSTVSYSSGKHWSVSGHVVTRDRTFFSNGKFLYGKFLNRKFPKGRQQFTNTMVVIGKDTRCVTHLITRM